MLEGIKNLEMLLQGVRKKVDVCYVDDTPFVYVACLGDYIDMAYSTPRSLKKKYGKKLRSYYKEGDSKLGFIFRAISCAFK